MLVKALLKKNEVFVNDVEFVSSEDKSKRRLVRGQEHDACAQAWLARLGGSLSQLLFLQSLSLFEQILMSETTVVVVPEDHVEVVVNFDVHLDGVHHIEVASTLLDVSSRVRDRTLTRENLRHVVVLHVGQGFSVVFRSSAAQVVEVVDDLVHSSVHDHQINLAH